MVVIEQNLIAVLTRQSLIMEVKDLMLIEMLIVVVLILIVMVVPSLAKRAIIAVLA